MRSSKIELSFLCVVNQEVETDQNISLELLIVQYPTPTSIYTPATEFNAVALSVVVVNSRGSPHILITILRLRRCIFFPLRDANSIRPMKYPI